MNFGWSEDQMKLRREAVTFAQHELNELSRSQDGEPRFHRDLWQRCADFGVQGSFAPASLGGQARDILSTVLMLEGIGYGCKDNGFTLGLNGHMWAVMEPLLRFGNAEQLEKYIPGMCNGSIIGAHGMTEADSGSDAFSLRTEAKRVDGGYVLDGQKVLIGLGPVCDLALIFASTNPARKEWGISAFLVDAGSDGFEAGPEQKKMGVNGSPLGEIVLTSCFVPEKNRLGPEGAGTSIFSHSMEWERSFIFASHVGAMERQLDAAIAYAGKRQVFGQKIGKFQSVSNRIADMKVRLETSKLLMYRCAWQKQTDEKIALDAALTKLHVSESFLQSSIDSTRLHGALGYLSEYGIERDLRDAMGGVIYSGTSDIQRQLIARMLGT